MEYTREILKRQEENQESDGNDTQDEKGFGISPNPKEVIKYIGKNKDLLPHKEEVGFVLTSDKKY